MRPIADIRLPAGTVCRGMRQARAVFAQHSTWCYSSPLAGLVVDAHLTRWFDRWARKEGITHQSLCRAVREILGGLYDADLGGGLLKKRVPRAGGGKSGGYRTLVATNRDSRWIFVYGFSRNERSNIDREEQLALKRLASHFLQMSDPDFTTAIERGEITKVNCHAES